LLFAISKGFAPMSSHESQVRDDAPPLTSRHEDVRKAEAYGEEGTLIGRTVTINRPREEIYAFWRNFSNLAQVLENVVSIENQGPDRSHWVVKAPGGRTVEWDSQVVEDQPGELIAWVSEEGADIGNSGKVEFFDAAPGRGTMVRATIAYDPPFGAFGEWIAKIMQREPNLQARRDLRRLKQFLETGEISNSAGPSARKSESPTEQYL
jgi:uncharacterized membrane protein